MPEEIFMVIDTDGTIQLIGDAPLARRVFGDDAASVAQRRASHVEPMHRVLRAAFRLARRVGGDSGRLAAFTRRWPCRWQADLAPSRGPVLAPFACRADAIAAEVAWLQAAMSAEGGV